MIHHHFTEPATIPELLVFGDRDKDKGIVVNLKDPSETVYIGQITAFDVFVPITVLSGRLLFKKAYIRDYGGDCWDVFGGTLQCDLIHSRSNKPTRPYEQYHQDFGQIDGLTDYKKDPRKKIEKIRIKRVDAVLHGKDAQGISLTGNGLVNDIRIGYEKFHLQLDGYPHVINGFQCANSLFGGLDVKTNGDVYIKNRNDFNKHKTSNVLCSNIDVNPYSNPEVRHFDTGNLTPKEYLESMSVLGFN